MSNGTAESHTEPQDREREGEREGESRGKGKLRDLVRDCKYIDRGEKHLGGVDMCTFMGPCLCVECI